MGYNPTGPKKELILYKTLRSSGLYKQYLRGVLTCPCNVFKRSSKFLGVASATGTKTGPSPMGNPVVSSKNCSLRLPASLGTCSISCCSLDLSAASVRCLLLGGGSTVVMMLVALVL